MDKKYEIVVGLEIHAQLLTKTKLFCGDSASFGASPNTHVSPITLGHPGTLPKLNGKAVEYAIIMGLACGCDIEKVNYFARKNYFYPDLPKGYQITQHTNPICKNGHVSIKIADKEKKIRLNRIHMEEDAGKSLHDIDAAATSIDYNRAGVPLIEIVTEPDIRSADETYQFLTELRKILRYLEICDGNMEEGSMRCDVNISIREEGEEKLGTKAEIKNLNSIRNAKRAVEFEARRMTELISKGETILQETRSFDAINGTTFSLRSKEEANDYRYFPDPDLPPFIVIEETIEKLRANLPALPEKLIKKYVEELNLPEYDAIVITDEKDISNYFEKLISKTQNYKAGANWLLGPVKSYLNEHNLGINEFPVAPVKLAALIALIDSGTINFSIASSKVFPEMCKRPDSDPAEICTSLNLGQNSDEQEVIRWVEQALNKMPEKVAEYKKGKKGLIGLFVGEVKKISGGKADPKITNKLLLEKLES